MLCSVHQVAPHFKYKRLGQEANLQFVPQNGPNWESHNHRRVLVDTIVMMDTSKTTGLYFFVPFTLRTMFLAVFRTLPPRVFPVAAFALAGLETDLAVCFFTGDTLALTGLLDGAFLATGLRGDFAWDCAFVGAFRAGLLEPLAAAVAICFLVSADGRLSWVVFTLVALAGGVFPRGPRTAALSLAAPLTVGSLTFFFVVALPCPVVEALFFWAAAFPRAGVALEMAFLTPALIDLGVKSLRFLPWGEAVISVALESFRLVPVSFFVA